MRANVVRCARVCVIALTVGAALLAEAGQDQRLVTAAAAVAEPHADIVTALLNAGADPRASTLKGFTPLMFAARAGNIALAEALLEAGVDVNEPSADDTSDQP